MSMALNSLFFYLFVLYSFPVHGSNPSLINNSFQSLKLSLFMFSGDQSQGAASPVQLKKDVESMEKGKDCLSTSQLH